MFRFLALIIGLVFGFSSALADDFSSVKGLWVCTSGCGCTPASPSRYASISSSGTARNECGAQSVLVLTGNRIQATDWATGATLSPDDTQINWDNNSVWSRLPANAPDLDQRVAWDESRAFYCESGLGRFPSKEAESGAPACDDSDSVMFNALLCRSGDPRGCNTVKLSQDDNGRFWRSPKRKLERPADPTAADDAIAKIQSRDLGETTFSGDHATGLFVYFGHMGDKEKDAFKNWIAWIDSNERCLTFCGAMPIGTPRFCKNDRCAFRPGDCSVLVLLGRKLGVGVPFCTIDPISPIPTVVNLAQAMKNSYDETIGKFPIQPPMLKLLRDNFDKALKAYEDAIAPIEELRTRVEAEAVRALMLAQIEATLSAKLNDRGFSRHNALVEIMILQDWGLGKSWMSNAAGQIADNEPLNPFFQYVAHRRSNKDSMLPLIGTECPNEATDTNHLRRQWSWERDTAKKEWNNTMYWDCLFIAAMYREKGAPPPDDDSTENALRAALIQAINLANAALATTQGSLKAITDLLAEATNPVDAAKKKIDEAVDAAKNPGQTVQKKVDDARDTLSHPGQAITHPVETIRRLNPF
jgi:hypothetical protein